MTFGQCVRGKLPVAGLSLPPRAPPAEAGSDVSVSDFLSVSSQAFEEGREPPPFSSLRRRPSTPGGTADMSGEGNHGDKAQCNGVKKHRWDLAPVVMS